MEFFHEAAGYGTPCCDAGAELGEAFVFDGFVGEKFESGRG